MTDTILKYLEACQKLQRETTKAVLTIAYIPDNGHGIRITFETYRPRYDRWCFLFSSSQTDEENEREYQRLLEVYKKHEHRITPTAKED